MEKSMGKVLWFIETKKYFKENGWKIKNAERGHKNFQIIVSFQETMKMESRMERVFINGLMDKLIKVIGKMDKDKALATGLG
jgi:hypothetical protein